MKKPFLVTVTKSYKGACVVYAENDTEALRKVKDVAEDYSLFDFDNPLRFCSSSPSYTIGLATAADTKEYNILEEEEY